MSKRSLVSDEARTAAHKAFADVHGVADLATCLDAALDAAAPHIAAAQRDSIAARLADRWPGTSSEAIDSLIGWPS